MTRVVTFNANGIRSAARKGFWGWVDEVDPDVLCIQELKAQEADLTDEVVHARGMHAAFACAQKPGYSGVGIYTRRKPDAFLRGFDNGEFDAEGRYVEARFGNVSVISTYFPSGTSSPLRQEAKYRFLAVFLAHINALKAEGRDVLFCGDINIAHQNKDVKNWKGNLKNSGFLPEERAWIGARFDEGWVDVYRAIDDAPDRFTWWSQRGHARDKNVGWRIDYQIATPAIASKARAASIAWMPKFSDHGPVTIDYEDWL